MRDQKRYATFTNMFKAKGRREVEINPLPVIS